MKRFNGTLRHLMVSSVVALIAVISIIGLNVVGVNAQESRKPSAGIRLQFPVSAVLGETYEQKVLNIYNAGKDHEIHYICDFMERDLSDLTTQYYSDGPHYKEKIRYENKLPAGLEMDNSGNISGTPTVPGIMLIWFDVTWSGSDNEFSTLPSLDDPHEGFYDAVRIEIYDKSDTKSGHKDIPESATKIDINKEIQLSAKSDCWFEFTSPSCMVGCDKFESFMNREYTLSYGKGYDGIYDENGYPVATGAATNFFLLSPGVTYYMHLKNDTEEQVTLNITSMARGMTVDQYLENITTDLSAFQGDIRRTQTNVNKVFENDTNTEWDIYSVTESWNVDKGILKNRFLMFYNSYVVDAPYKVHFGIEGFDFDFTNQYQVSQKITTEKTLGSFSNVPLAENIIRTGQSNVTYVWSDDDLYGKSTYSYEIYVPVGKKLKDDNGIWKDSTNEDICVTYDFDNSTDNVYVDVSSGKTKIGYKADKEAFFPVKNGYVLVGWQTPDGKVHLYDEEIEVSEPIIIKAIWKKVYKVEYSFKDANLGTVNSKFAYPQSILPSNVDDGGNHLISYGSSDSPYSRMLYLTEGEYVIGQYNESGDVYPVTRDGYVFNGWKSNKDAKIYKQNDKVQINSDVVFEAQWSAKSDKEVKKDDENTNNKSNGDVVSNSSKENSKKITAPKTVKITAVKNKKKKSFFVSWKRIKNVKGYQIQYAKNKKFTKSKKSIFSKKNSFTVKNLSKKKTYYVRVRAYKLSGKTKVYGKWSSIKIIKITK